MKSLFVCTILISSALLACGGSGSSSSASFAGTPSPVPSPAPSSPRDVMVPMPDGVRLATTVYLPGGSGPWPVLLVRTPYGRNGVDFLASGLNSLGVALVTQDTRGRFGSEGQYGVFFNDKTDGIATLNWIIDQPWSNGRIATWGASALGIAQYLMAPGAPDGLVCQWVEVATPDLYDGTIYHGGAFRSELAMGLLGILNGEGLLSRWQSNYLNTSYWDPVQITDQYNEVHVAAVHIGGWYDVFIRGTINAFLGYEYEGGIGAAGRQHLIVGPWTHVTFNTPNATGELTFPDAASPDYHAWFGVWLRTCLIEGSDVADGDRLSSLPKVRYYTMGAVGEKGAPGNEWRTAETWPPPGSIETPLYVSPNDMLSFEGPSADGGGDTFQYDPLDPSPTVGGGNLQIAGGAYDQRPVERREDVVVYTSEPLEELLEVTGDVRAEMWITTDVPDTDLAVRLTDVYPDGRSILIADGIFRARYHNSLDFTTESFLQAGVPYLLSVDLGPTSMVFNRGHRIRISVTSSNYPRFNPNPNTGSMFLEPGTSGRIATTTILRSAAFPSAVILPVMER